MFLRALISPRGLHFTLLGLIMVLGYQNCSPVSFSKTGAINKADGDDLVVCVSQSDSPRIEVRRDRSGAYQVGEEVILAIANLTGYKFLSVDFGDGHIDNSEPTTDELEVRHSYRRPGIYSIRVRAFDNCGLEVNVFEESVTVEATPTTTTTTTSSTTSSSTTSSSTTSSSTTSSSTTSSSTTSSSTTTTSRSTTTTPTSSSSSTTSTSRSTTTTPTSSSTTTTPTSSSTTTTPTSSSTTTTSTTSTTLIACRCAATSRNPGVPACQLQTSCNESAVCGTSQREIPQLTAACTCFDPTYTEYYSGAAASVATMLSRQYYYNSNCSEYGTNPVPNSQLPSACSRGEDLLYQHPGEFTIPRPPATTGTNIWAGLTSSNKWTKWTQWSQEHSIRVQGSDLAIRQEAINLHDSYMNQRQQWCQAQSAPDCKWVNSVGIGGKSCQQNFPAPLAQNCGVATTTHCLQIFGAPPGGFCGPLFTTSGSTFEPYDVYFRAQPGGTCP